MRILALAASTLLALATPTLADSCSPANARPSGPPSTGAPTGFFLYNNVNVPAMIYFADPGGGLRVQTDVGGMGLGEVRTYRNQVYMIETSLDGVPVCAGTIIITGPGECHVSLDQDADNFYLSPEGSCETM